MLPSGRLPPIPTARAHQARLQPPQREVRPARTNQRLDSLIDDKGYDADALIERLRHARPAPKIYLQGTAGSQQHFILAKRLLRAQPEPRCAGIAEINRGRGTADQGGKVMLRTLTIAVASATVLALSPIAFAQQTGGTADEAKAMLMKAVAAVKADKAKALDMFNKGEGGFR